MGEPTLKVQGNGLVFRTDEGVVNLGPFTVPGLTGEYRLVPASPASSEEGARLELLVAEWRKRANERRTAHPDAEYIHGACNAFDTCADQLLAALRTGDSLPRSASTDALQGNESRGTPEADALLREAQNEIECVGPQAVLCSEHSRVDPCWACRIYERQHAYLSRTPATQTEGEG